MIFDDEREPEPGENLMFWVNVVGISLATSLLGSFFLLYGGPFLALVTAVLFGPPNVPDR